MALRQRGARSEEEKPEGRGEVAWDTAVQSHRPRLGFRAYSGMILAPGFTQCQHAVTFPIALRRGELSETGACVGRQELAGLGPCPGREWRAPATHFVPRGTGSELYERCNR